MYSSESTTTGLGPIVVICSLAGSPRSDSFLASRNVINDIVLQSSHSILAPSDLPRGFPTASHMDGSCVLFEGRLELSAV